jgi:hypothetical protein
MEPGLQLGLQLGLRVRLLLQLLWLPLHPDWRQPWGRRLKQPCVLLRLLLLRLLLLLLRLLLLLLLRVLLQRLLLPRVLLRLLLRLLRLWLHGGWLHGRPGTLSAVLMLAAGRRELAVHAAAAAQVGPRVAGVPRQARGAGGVAAGWAEPAGTSQGCCRRGRERTVYQHPLHALQHRPRAA